MGEHNTTTNNNNSNNKPKYIFAQEKRLLFTLGSDHIEYLLLAEFPGEQRVHGCAPGPVLHQVQDLCLQHGGLQLQLPGALH